MINKIYDKNLGTKLVWEDIKMEVIAIKAIGNYSKFVFDNFSKSNFYNTKTEALRNYTVIYQELLNEGKCIFHKDYLVFKEGFEKDYAKYVLDYTDKINGDELLIFNELKDKSSFSRVKSYIKMFKNNVIKKETLLSIISDKFINIDSVYEIIK